MPSPEKFPTGIPQAPDQIKGANEAENILKKEEKTENEAKFIETKRGIKIESQDWLTSNASAKKLERSRKVIKKIAEDNRIEHPEWFRKSRNAQGRGYEEYSPELIGKMEKEVSKIPTASEKWFSDSEIRDQLKLGRYAIETITKRYKNEKPEWFRKLRDSSGQIGKHYSTEFLEKIKQEPSNYEKAPKNLLIISDIRKEIYKITGVRVGLTRKMLIEEGKILPELFKKFRSPDGKISEYLPPEITEKLIQEFSEKKRAPEGWQVRTSLNRFINEVAENKTLEAQEFQKLIGLFGGSRVVDILYRHHPEFSGLPVENVKKVLADYLGEFLITKGAFNPKNISSGLEYLSDKTLREGLVEVVKDGALSFYNQEKHLNQEEGDRQIFERYLNNLSQEFDPLENKELDSVLEEIREYYRSLFVYSRKPDHVREQLREGRMFPDVSQMINIKEIADKKRILIADEMGVGKSASAILAKEYLGLNKALITAPSNVIETWKSYLSDGPDGYFKNGLAPKFLEIENLESLKKDGIEDFDYILISHEKLNEGYTKELESIGFDMLIVDELHKLKNLRGGVRSNNLIQLAEKVEGENKYLALLSGTPVPNKVGDLAIILKLLYPEKFWDIDNKNLVRNIIRGDLIDLRSLLIPRMQMKGLSDNIEMSLLTESIIELDLSEAEKEAYLILLEEDELTPSQKMMTLRQFLMNPEILNVTPSIENTKASALSEQLKKSFKEKDKVVMFVNGYIEDVMRGKKSLLPDLELPPDVEIRTIEGNIGDKEERKRIQEELKTSDKKIFLAVSGDTSDVGVDFSGAEEVYFYNEPWTKYQKLQQLGRVYREGLKTPLESKTFITRGTIEEGIHMYTEAKYRAVEKLLRGIPITERENELLSKSERQDDPNLEKDPELAKYYLSSWDKLREFFSYSKEIGERDFHKFLQDFGREYAGCYLDLGTRSYQSNAARISGTLLGKFIQEKGGESENIKILDVASGPEVLKTHIHEDYQNQIFSFDINRYHFKKPGENRGVASFLKLPFRSHTFDYLNLSLALHYTKFIPSQNNYERLETLMEANRVLKNGGRVLINMIWSLELRDEKKFNKIADSIGFKIVEEYTGKADAGQNYRSSLIILEKIRDAEVSLEKTLEEIGKDNFDGIKFNETKQGLKDSRKIIERFNIGEREYEISFNNEDKKALVEEKSITAEAETLRREYGGVKDIPEELLVEHKFSRLLHPRRYILWKKLESVGGYVVIKD